MRDSVAQTLEDSQKSGSTCWHFAFGAMLS